ncbi:unnamed protein product [Candidula unifasciata]|uniref:Uncharacterized protein n=1 Tax=Candidula unifasciata TaxID=100452 RepID=A0A8S3ZAC5_9EUPU|nr:unnamed protein product [Candidula unifasciata]
MLADAGLEVASFNLAYLCEHNQNGVRKYISKECEWKHYNLSTQREPHFVDAYSYIKMGDYHWYGCLGHRNLAEAANQYSQAAVKGNPQALFNLAYMVEEGVDISPVIWWRLHLSSDIYTSKVRLLLELYARCRESRQSEAFMPCCLAWFRIWCLDIWDQYHIYMKVTSFLSVFVTITTTTYLVYRHFLQRRIDRQNELERKAAEEEEDRGRLADLQNIVEVEENDDEEEFEDI